MFGLFKGKRKKKKYVKPEINIVEKETYAYALTCINKIPGYLNVTIQKKGCCCRNYLVSLGLYADEYVQKLVSDADECKKLYDNYNDNTKICIAKSLFDDSYKIIT